MEQAGKVLSWFEKANIPVSVGTVIATIAVLAVLAYVVLTKYYPAANRQISSRVTKQMEKEKKDKQLQEVLSKQKDQEEQMGQILETLAKMSGSMEELKKGMESSMNGHKVTLSVLLDIVECMQAATSPEECARQAQSKINGYFGTGKLPLQ